MNVLVTGVAGFIGQRLAVMLANRGHQVFGLYHDRTPFGCIRWKNIHGNILDYARMMEIIVDREIDQIYHLASKAIVRNCRLDPLGCVAANVEGTASILEAARQSERIQGILVAESDKSYGPSAVPYREDQSLKPAAIYEASKACVSHLMTAYALGYGLSVASVRCANVYGAGDPNRSRLVPNTILRILCGQQPQITAGAEQYRREFIHVDDACEAYIRIMGAGPWGQAINVGSGECHTVREVVDMICELMGVNAEPEEWERPATLTEIENQWLCIDRLRSIWPKFQPRTMAETLPDIINQYKAYFDGI